VHDRTSEGVGEAIAINENRGLQGEYDVCLIVRKLRLADCAEKSIPQIRS